MHKVQFFVTTEMPLPHASRQRHRLHKLAGNREANFHKQSSMLVVGETNLAMVHIHNPFHDGQPQTTTTEGARFFSPGKRL